MSEIRAGRRQRADGYRQHLPISERLIQVLERGRRAGELDDGPPVSWFVAATISLGHAAGQEVAAGRMPMQAAGEAFRRGVLSLCTGVGTPPPAGDRPGGPAAAAP